LLSFTIPSNKPDFGKKLHFINCAAIISSFIELKSLFQVSFTWFDLQTRAKTFPPASASETTTSTTRLIAVKLIWKKLKFDFYFFYKLG
jgi:hypothetical protein